MDASASPKVLYLVGVLLMTFNLQTCVHSQGVWFSLRGTTYQNNSCVALEDIGKGDDALLCVTNLTASNFTGSSLRNWFFPNGTRVPSRIVTHTSGEQWDFYRTRSEMVVRLNRKRGGEEGIYRCEIPDAMNVIHTIYIGVYTAGTGVWFSLRGTTYQNNSCVALEDIGEGDDALICVANLTASDFTGSSLRNWFFPNGTRVPGRTANHTSGEQWDFYRTRGEMVVRLNRRRGGDDGIYRCEIHDSTNVIHTIYIGVYTVGTECTPLLVVQPTNIPSSDGATTTSIIIVVAVVIMLVVIVVGAFILVVFFRAKKKQLEINNLQNVPEDIEMKVKHEGIEKEDSSNADQPPYAEIQTEATPHIPSMSEELIEYLNQNNSLDGGYSEIELEAAKPPRQVNTSDPMSEKLEFSTAYQDIDQHHSTTSLPQERDVYTMSDTTSSHTKVETPSGIYETVYSEPIQPSLFTDAEQTASSDSENLHPYGPIYTVPTDLPKSEGVLLKVLGGNIQEICELGMGHFGKVILAETVGLSAKDLRLSESDDDKSKSVLVAVKKLKSDAPNATKQTFEKEVKFMSRLGDRNVIRILGVCYEDTPFIMMEYMEKGDLNQYLQKFKTLSTTDSEPQGQITINTLVSMATQIASAMKYLASHNFVHRDLATRNCLVGPNYLVKISDFGMSRSLYDSHYYRIHGRFVLPVRWMAYECFYGKFSQKSDVWAFGVTMWEIFTLAKEQPYNNMSDKQVVENALKGKNRKILAKPDVCPLKVYKIMLECWEHNSDHRATFDELFQLLTSIHFMNIPNV